MSTRRAKEGRVSLRIDTELKRRMLAYCRREGVTLSALVSQYFRELLKQDEARHVQVDADSF